jgi:hypothetical protein
MSWAKTGWGGVDEADKEAESMASEYGPRRFWMPPENTKRIMFLDDSPFGFWEHSVKMNGNWRNYFICLSRNGISDNCVIDGLKAQNLYYIGFLSVVDFSSWTSQKGKTYQYDVKLYGAKLGSSEKPGILKKLRRLRDRHNGLVGKIFDVYRSGAKTEGIGDEFTLVETIPPEKIHDYARSIGVNPGPKTEQTPDGKNWVPFNYAEIFKPKSNDELRGLVGLGSSQQGPGSQPGVYGQQQGSFGQQQGQAGQQPSGSWANSPSVSEDDVPF